MLPQSNRTENTTKRPTRNCFPLQLIDLLCFEVCHCLCLYGCSCRGGGQFLYGFSFLFCLSIMWFGCAVRYEFSIIFFPSFVQLLSIFNIPNKSKNTFRVCVPPCLCSQAYYIQFVRKILFYLFTHSWRDIFCFYISISDCVVYRCIVTNSFIHESIALWQNVVHLRNTQSDG